MPSVLIFIITVLLLATDFYYLKNIAGRRLVGLRWWNEVDTSTGDSHWVFESQDRGGDASGAGAQNLTDKRFFWLALYAQPALWVGLAIFAIIRFENPIWLSLVGEFFPASFLSYRFCCCVSITLDAPVSGEEKWIRLSAAENISKEGVDCCLLLSYFQGTKPIDFSNCHALFFSNKYLQIYSHRPRSHHHKHDRLLAVRSLQPRVQFSVERDVFGGHSPEPGWWCFQSSFWGQPMRRCPERE